MKILPKISKMSFSNISLVNEDYTLVTINDKNLLAFKETANSNNDIVSDLIECNAFATTLLYLNENYKLEVGKFKDIFTETGLSAEDYYSDCEKLLTQNIKIVEEAGIPLVNIKGYQIFEGQGYILRGNGKKKLKESFDEISLEDITLDYLKTRTDDPFITGMIECSECGCILDMNEVSHEEDREYSEDKYDGFDNYHTETKTGSVTIVTCPYCGHSEDLEDCLGATVDDLFGAGNAEELVPGINSLDEEVITEEVEDTDLDIDKLASDLVDYMWDYDTYDFNDKYSSKDEAFEYTLAVLSTKEGVDTIIDRLIDVKDDTAQIRDLIARLQEVKSTLTEDAEGVQTSDIAPKVDQELGITDAKPKKKYYDILLSDINEDSMPIINKGFMKNANGQYQRGNYILVKEGDKYLAIHKNKLQEYTVDADNNIVYDTAISIADKIKHDLDAKLSDKITTKVTNLNGDAGILITRKGNEDLVTISDLIVKLLTTIGVEKDQYEIEFKGDNLIIALQNIGGI